MTWFTLKKQIWGIIPCVPPFSDTVKWLMYCQLYWAQSKTLNSTYDEYLVLFGQEKCPALQSDTRNTFWEKQQTEVGLGDSERSGKMYEMTHCLLNSERTQRIIAEDSTYFRCDSCFTNKFCSLFHVLLVLVVKEETTVQRLQSSITLFSNAGPSSILC